MTKENSMTETELIDECKPYLDCFDIYMTTTDEGKRLWSAASPYIFQQSDLFLSELENVFKVVIDFYYKKYDDDFNNCINNLLLNYFMLNYCIINEFNLCKKYGQAILDNIKHFKQSSFYQEYLTSQKSNEAGPDFKKEIEFIKKQNLSLENKNRILEEALEIVCKRYDALICPYSNNHSIWKKYYTKIAEANLKKE